MAANRPEVVRQALTHLPVAEWTEAQIHRLNAWLTSKQGDLRTERRELELLLETDPADLPALERLAQLAEQDGQPAQAAELGRKKKEIERLRARYEYLYERVQPIRDAVEMANLAEHLGRQFEARAFLTLAIANDPYAQGLAARSRTVEPAPAGCRGPRASSCPRPWLRSRSETKPPRTCLLAD